LSEFTFRLALLFFPGIISAILVEKLVTTQTWSDFRFALNALVLGLSCYMFYALGLAAILQHWPPNVSLFSALGNGQPISYEEVLTVTAIAPLIAFAVSYVIDHHWLNRFAKRWGISKRFGDRDVWSYTFNSSDISNYWVVVRDFDRDLAFEGWANAYAETADENEILLTDVKVYRSSSSEFLYEIESVYLKRKKDDLTIEFRKG